MTSVRTCYCKHERDVPCRKDNDVGPRKEKRQLSTASRRSLIKNSVCRNSEESRKMRSVINEKTSLNNRSAEMPPDSILSPETSTVLENAEKIVGNTKIQLMEICGMSKPDSAQRNRNTCLNDLPLDDESEQLLYIRELVASKFREACEDASGKASSREPARVTARGVDLSAPKFQMSQRRRRRDDWSSLGYEGADDRGSRERAPLTEMPSKDSLRDEDAAAAAARDDRARDRRRASSSVTEREPVRARGNACRIQIGPALNIVDRELTRQDLENVHISPEPSRAQGRANTATYVLCHDACKPTSADNETETSLEMRTVLYARLDPLQREKRGRLIDFSADAAPETEAATTNASGEAERHGAEHGDSPCGQDDGRIESSIPSQAPKCVCEETKERNDRDTEETATLERLAINQGAANCAVMVDSGSGNEKSKRKNGNQAEVTVRDDTGNRHAEGAGGTFDKRSDIGRQAVRPRDDGGAADEIRQGNQSDRSKPPPFPAACEKHLRKIGFPRRENITSPPRCCAVESTRAIDECSSNTRDDRYGQTSDEPLHHVAGEDPCRRSFIPSEVELYQPRFDHLDSILFSNEERLERVTRAADNLVELLSRPEFMKYRLDERTTTPRCGVKPGKKIPLATSELTRSLRPSETESRNEDLTVSCPMDASLPKMPAEDDAAESTKSSIPASETDRDDDPEELSVCPASEASDDFHRSSRDEARRLKVEAYPSDASTDKSDVTTSFSDMLPALSSTRTTEAQTCHRYRQKQIDDDRRVDAAPCATAANRFSRRDTDFQKQRRSGDILSRVLRGLKDTSGSAADRFVTCVLQDERHSIERKIASALKESTIVPITVQRLLDRLREVESIRNQTETLGILKNILIDVKCTDEEDAKKASRCDKETSCRDFLGLSVCTNRTNSNETEKLISRNDENSQEARTVASEIERIGKNSRDLEGRDDRSSSLSRHRDTRKCCVRSEARPEAIGGPNNNNNNNGSKREDSYSEAESLTQISDIRSDDDGDPGENSKYSCVRSVRASDRAEALDDAAIAASENGGCECNVRSEGHGGARNEADANQAANESTVRATVDETIDTRLLNSIPAAAKATAEKAEHDDDVASTNKNGSPGLSETRESVRSSGASAGPSFVSKISEGSHVTFARSSSKRDGGSARATRNAIDSQHPAEKTIKEGLSLARSCSADSLRGCASLSSVKTNGSSLREIVSPERISFNHKREDNSMERDGTGGKPMTTTTTDNGGLELPKSAASDNERQSTNVSEEHDSLPNSNSSVNSTLLDQDYRCTNGTSDVKVEGFRIGTSSEGSSHSEGELYMPSSCSYSLGEVRVLRKRNSIADNTMDRDSSSVTILVTKSMLTSLNDSTSLGSCSGRGWI